MRQGKAQSLIENKDALLDHVKASEFAWTERLIHLFVGGSELHGAKVHGTDDIDIYGVYIEPPELILGLETLPHFVWSTAGNERRNTAGDVDVTLYSLRKWAGLAVKGNPTALHFLFVAGVLRHPVWQRVREQKALFLSRMCVPNFLGFANDQLQRLTGEKGRGKKGQRPELEAKFGFDPKAAMHTLRLLYECREIVTTGEITLPRPEKGFLIKVRTGGLPLNEVLQCAEQLFAECREAEKTSVLPEKVDRKAVSKLVAEAYRQSWNSDPSLTPINV